VIEVVTWAALSSHQAALTLCVVSSWTREIALRYAWDVFVRAYHAHDLRPRVRASDGAPQILRPGFQVAGTARRTLDRRQPTDLFPLSRGPLVRALWADKTRLREPAARSVFDACRGVVDLALSWDRFRDLASSRFLWNRPDVAVVEERGRPHPDALHYPRAHRESPTRALTVLSPWIMFGWKSDAFMCGRPADAPDARADGG
jgi:hypothetical protein